MSNLFTSDAPQRHQSDEKTCFFCMKRTKNWGAYAVPITESSAPELKNVYPVGSRPSFLICPHCSDTMSDEDKAANIAEFIIMEETHKHKLPFGSVADLVHTPGGRIALNESSKLIAQDRKKKKKQKKQKKRNRKRK